MARAPKPRKTYHHGDLPRVLREETVRLVNERGPDAVSLREIARRIGVNHAAAYRHYEDKDALLAAVAEEGWTRLADEMEAAASTRSHDVSAVDTLLAIGSAYAEFAFAEPAYFRIMTGPRLNRTGRFPSLEVPVARCFATLVNQIERGRKEDRRFLEGSSRDWAVRLWMATHGFADLVLTRRVAVKPARTREYLHLLLRPMFG